MKKHPVLAAILGVFAVVCLAGIAMSTIAALEKSSKESEIEKKKKILSKLENRGKLLALSEENVELGNANKAALAEAERSRFGEMLQPKRLDSEFKGDSTTFRTNLEGLRQNWTRLCEENEIEVSADLASKWGFERYLKDNESAPAAFLKALDVETKIVETVLKELADARRELEGAQREARIISLSQRPQVFLLEIQREAIELGNDQSRSAKKDEFVILPEKDAGNTGLCMTSSGEKVPFISLRRAGTVDAIAFRFKLAAESGVIRNQLRRLENYPLYVRDLSASRSKDFLNKKAPGAPEKEAAPAASGIENPFGLFGAPESGPAAGPEMPKRPERIVAVDAKPEIFTLLLEYTIPVVKKQNE